MPRLLVVIPTVTGREHHLRRCERAYRAVTPPDVQLDIATWLDKPTCGEVWNTGARFAATLRADYVHMTADDLEPLPGSIEAAIEIVDKGATPSALIWTARDGQPDTLESHGTWAMHFLSPTEVDMSRIPFCRPEQWIPIPPIHYWSDNAFSVACRVQSIPMIADQRYAFRHHWASEGRIAMNSEQWYREQATYEQWANQQLAALSPRWS